MSDRTDITLWRFTAADADALAGRTLTADELERIGRAVGFSSIPDALDEVVGAVADEPS